MLSKSRSAPSVRPFHYPNPQEALHCDRVSLSKLAAKFGTPSYVYSAEHILHRLSLFQNAFAPRKCVICYAVKANSNLSLLKLLAKRGAGFDLVSGGELARVLAVDKRAARRAVFSGVGKMAAEIDAALAARILMFNVESEAEVGLLAARAKKAGVRARVALRVNPDVFAETHPYISTGMREHKFGIDIGRARSVYREIKRSRHLEPAGISVHIGSQIRAVEPFGAALDAVSSLARELAEDGIRIAWIDAGGGLGIDYHADPARPEPSSEKSPAAQVVQYAAAINQALKGLDVTLLLEPGRFLVAQAGALLTRVLNVKRNGEKTFVITDAGMNDLIRPALYQAHHAILPVVPAADRPVAPVDVVGPVCETGDFFAHDRAMQEVQEGDLLAVLDAGAYGMSQASNYNSRPRPAEVLVEGKKARLIRKRETIRDLLRPELNLL